MRSIKIILTVAFLLGITIQCSDDFLEKTPPSSLTEDIFFITEEDALATVNAAYAAMQLSPMYSENYPKIAEVPSDDVTLDNTSGLSFDNFTFNAAEGQLDGFYQSCYEGIFRANLAIQRIPEIDINQDLKNRLVGEAKFLRALYYWHLATMFGDVPLILEADASDLDKGALAKSDKSAIFDQMITDLSEAEAALPEEYGDADVGRASKGAAQALLGKVYLYDEDYTNAELNFLKVINSENYSLVPDFSNVISGSNENNEESIFEIQYANVGGNAWAGADGANNNETNLRWRLNLPQGRGGFGNILPTQDIVDAFEEGDPRLDASIFIDGDEYDDIDPVYSADWTITGYTIKKGMMPIQRNEAASGTNWPIIRYADVLLMYAEAANENGNLQDAIDAINEVRARVDMPPHPSAEYPVSNQQEVFDAIVHERRVELAFEYHRYNDLRRWGLAVEELGPLGYEPRNRYYPLPQAELDVNPELEQNPDY
ncbi:MAG: RagB/SusD family nutrient uptake outer membrane protein [Candidatus Cyclobacteriaceae bacterium M3_2C_046]